MRILKWRHFRLKSWIHLGDFSEYRLLLVWLRHCKGIHVFILCTCIEPYVSVYTCTYNLLLKDFKYLIAWLQHTDSVISKQFFTSINTLSTWHIGCLLFYTWFFHHFHFQIWLIGQLLFNVWCIGHFLFKIWLKYITQILSVLFLNIMHVSEMYI